MSNLLVRILGWPATVIQGDTMVFDRWQWLRRRLPLTASGAMSVIDVGCGSGAFTLGAARRGYRAVGLSWDERNQAIAMSRARILRLSDVTFPICDVRCLSEYSELKCRFDVAICTEHIEHVIDDKKLLIDIYACLKPGGRLLLTTPNFFYHPMARSERGPFHEIEDGAHVRRGYSASMLMELCREAGFFVEEIGHVSHTFSQLATRLHRAATAVLGRVLGWFVTVPFRVLPPLLDPWLGRWLGRFLGWPGYSITLSAYKPRFEVRQGSADLDVVAGKGKYDLTAAAGHYADLYGKGHAE